MSDLVPDSALLARLPSDADAGIAAAVLETAEALFEAACGRSDRPFSDALPGRVEVQDGTGTDTLYLDYPVDTLTGVVLGLDPTAPDETLIVSGTGKNVYVDGRMPRRLRRTDGGVFSAAGCPLRVHVTYDTASDLPEDAAEAVLRAAQLLYEQRVPGQAVERLGGYSVETPAASGSVESVLLTDPVWTLALAAHGVVTV